ncbi:hypothetical protein vseg_012332 [Gypsophila vaccaria]
MDSKNTEKVINWEDYQHQLAIFTNLSSTLHHSTQIKQSFRRKLDSFVLTEAESLSRKYELDEISKRVEDKKLVLGNMVMQAKVVEEHAKTKEEHLSGEIRSLLVSGNSLTVSQKRLQELNRSLSGERGYARLSSLQKTLRARQQLMISYVSFIYPVKTVIGAAQELELDSFPNGNIPGTSGGSVDENRRKGPGTLSISGVQLTMNSFIQPTLFTDKKQTQKSTTALGYVAHAISLIASYLHVPLRYPLRLGGSHSYIKDCAPLIEPASSISSSTTIASAYKKCLEFPLFMDGNDATRTAYAIFLLNKDIEQLLNYVGVESLGPRQLLANLKELYRTILSPEFAEKGTTGA